MFAVTIVGMLDPAFHGTLDGTFDGPFDGMFTSAASLSVWPALADGPGIVPAYRAVPPTFSGK